MPDHAMQGGAGGAGGDFRRAAGKLKDALLAKRNSEQGKTLAANLDRAIALVDAFRETNQDAKAFSRLKEDVRMAVVPQASPRAPMANQSSTIKAAEAPAAAAASPRSQEAAGGLAKRASASTPPLTPLSRALLKTPPRTVSAASDQLLSRISTPDIMFQTTGRGARERAYQAFNQHTYKTSGPACVLSAIGPTLVFSKNRPWSTDSTPPSRGGSEPNWDLPARALNKRAYAKQASTATFERMIVQQDEIALLAGEEEERQRLETIRRTREMFDGQLAELNGRRHDELMLKQQAKRDLDALRLRVQQEEAEERQRRHEKQVETFNIFKGQVDEVTARKDEEQQHKDRLTRVQRARLDKEERERKEELRLQAIANWEKNETCKRELLADLDRKAEALKARRGDEKRYNEAYMKLMDEQEAARRAVVEARAAKLKAAFEKAGGVAMESNLIAKQKADAERTARQLAEFNAAEDARFAKKEQDRRERTRIQTETLLAQMAFKESQKQERIEADRQIKARLERERAEELTRAAEEKRKEREARDAMQARQKEDMREEHKRKHFEYAHRFPESDAWVHAAVLDGRTRGFTNLSVPPSWVPQLAETLKMKTGGGTALQSPMLGLEGTSCS